MLALVFYSAVAASAHSPALARAFHAVWREPVRAQLRPHEPVRVARTPRASARAHSASAVRAAVGTSEPAHAALGPVVRAARAAIDECTGRGTESSGTGRVEWGTWLDADLRWRAIDALDNVCVALDGEAAWARLCARYGAIDAPVSLRVAGDDEGKRWDVLLHLLPAQSSELPGQPGDLGRVVKPTTGTLTLLKPLLGTTRVTKLRLDRDDRLQPIGVATDAVGAGYGSLGGSGARGAAAENTTVVLGGLHQHTAGRLGRAALLEVVLAPPHADAAERVPPLPACARLDVDADAELGALFARLGDADALRRAAGGTAGETAAESARRLSAAGIGTGGGGSGLSEQVGGLEAQLGAIVRRVLASRASPEAAARLGVSHVRGVLLSGPPGCGKTLLARELARQLGAREPQVVNGPEVLSKFVGEAEANVRRLFAPAAEEYAAAGAASALHVIILDEMDAIARARGSNSGDTSGVRDSVVNQLLAQMDGVKAAPNVLVIGCTNRPELIDPALLRPGRLEVQLDVALPDGAGRRDILRIHTRAMRQNGALAPDACALIDGADGTDGAERNLAARTEHFSGAELAGLVRSAASFALARASLAAASRAEGAAVLAGAPSLEAESVAVRAADFERALAEVTPALGKRDAQLQARFALHGVAPLADAQRDAQRALRLFVAAATRAAPGGGARVHSLLVLGEGAGAGATAAGAWATWHASKSGCVQYARILTPLDVLGAADAESARCAALADRFAEARSLGRAALLLDDVDRMLDGSPALAAALRALLREPLVGARGVARGANGGEDTRAAPALIVIGTCSDPVAARALALGPLFGAAVALPLVGAAPHAATALEHSAALGLAPAAAHALAAVALAELGPLGVKTLLALAERACALAAAAADVSSPDARDVALALGLSAGSPLAELQLRAMELACREQRLGAL
ncbi:hypothetical protein KFE25_007866 [Diacronema lutheri]|uniref:Vesicle-fusing ATPase n=1 Tax=Diacronema lutheri TaxID=2081491 RepID=A0A8J5XPV9_DIALT|nr:hypothetical protein KFE25_007866 [Diacronema lutheri]